MSNDDRDVVVLRSGSAMPATQTHVTLSPWALGVVLDGMQEGLRAACEGELKERQMTATITYTLELCPHPWSQERRARGEKAWCLVKIVTPEHGAQTEEPVAVFNLDSEAETFQGHLYAARLDPGLVGIDPSMRELFELRARTTPAR